MNTTTLTATAESILQNGLPPINVELPEIDWPLLWQRFTLALTYAIAACFIAGYLTGKLAHFLYRAGQRLRNQAAAFPLAGLLPAPPLEDEFILVEAAADPLQTKVQQLVNQGLSQRAIARELGIARHTVRRHLA